MEGENLVLCMYIIWQITLTFTAADLKESPHMEMTVDRGLAVGACLSKMIDRAGFSGMGACTFSN